jgi:membrane protease YdiL (CAAX protease family)
MSEEKPKRSIKNKIFFSPDERRLRAGWRLGLQTILLLFFLIFFSLLLGLFQIISEQSFMILNTILVFLSFTLSVLLARVWFDKRSITSLGLRLDRRTLMDVLVGFSISAGLIAILFGVEWALGWLTFTGFGWQLASWSELLGSLLIYFVIYLFTGWSEELLSRGYHLQTLASGTNLFWGVFLSSVIFAVMHLSNPNTSNFIMVIIGLIAAGLFMAYGYVRTGQLWVSIGIHIGWNFFEGSIFGFSVSGLNGSVNLVNSTVHGPVLWTGGEFGPEAGLLILPILLLGMGLIHICTQNRQAGKLTTVNEILPLDK